MKFSALIGFALLVLTQTVSFASGTNEYSCQGYNITVWSNGAIALTSIANNSFTNLRKVGPNDGFLTKSIVLIGTVIPIGQEIFDVVKVEIDVSLLGGAPGGQISVTRDLDRIERGSPFTNMYECTKQPLCSEGAGRFDAQKNRCSIPD